ncbi:hypothetical protein HanPSC8_Chr17g0784781 [Helianthus annuus]|nr:hypothetical protein HanPSC8_Chr17g0784781 [Helianthus annuus]
MPERRLRLSTTRPHGHVAKSPTSCPVPLTPFAKVSRLINIVVVEVTEFCLHTFAPRTWHDLIRPLIR